MARPISLVRFHLLMGSICLLMVGSSLAVLLLIELPSQQKSDAAQHGTRAPATVMTVTQHSGRAAQTDITVKLAEPPDLAGKTSTVHVNGLKTYRAGTTLTVDVQGVVFSSGSQAPHNGIFTSQIANDNPQQALAALLGAHLDGLPLTFSAQMTAVAPEPVTFGLAGAGLLTLGLIRRRRK